MTVWLEIGGKKRRVELPPSIVDGTARGPMECAVDGRVMQVDTQMLQPGVLSLVSEGRQYQCILDGDAVLIGGKRFEFEVTDPRSLQGRRGGGSGGAGPRAVKAPMPGRVVRVLAAAGEEVSEHQGIVVIEAMKMQNELKAPKAGRVARIAVSVGDAVAANEVLAVIE